MYLEMIDAQLALLRSPLSVEVEMSLSMIRSLLDRSTLFSRDYSPRVTSALDVSSSLMSPKL